MKVEMRYVLKVMMVVLLLGVGMLGGVALEREVLAAYVPADDVDSEVAPAFRLMAEAWNIIDEVYVDRSAVDTTRLAYGAIGGMVDALGDTGHSRFMTPEMREAQHQSHRNEFEGIGAYVESRDGLTVIKAPMEGSPAQAAGLEPGDAIVAVDGEDVTTLPMHEVVSRIVGPAGTEVTLTILDAESGESRDVTVERAAVELERVTWQMLPGTTVGQIRIAAFSQDVGADLEQALDELQAQGATGIVLDLRNNPGGFLREAILTASHFLEGGQPIVLRQDAEGRVATMEAHRGGVATGDLPLVVLINGGSASASEIVSGALQDHGRATLVGETTFGTGTVLNEFALSDGSAMMLATEQWLTPAGRVIWHQGIEPDVAVTLPEGAVPLVPPVEGALTVEELAASEDAQLLKALEILAQ